MAHELAVNELTGQHKFWSYRVPAWHRLGTISQNPATAVEAFDGVGAYDMALVGLQLVGGKKIADRAIVRKAPGQDDKVMGIVGPEYELMGPRSFVEAWDKAIPQPIETLGVLKDGAVLFISTKMPDFDVKGDEMQNYMLAYNGMSGKDAIRFDVTPVRAVCANTVRAAHDVASETLMLQHRKDALAEFESSLADAFNRCAARVGAVKEACELLASTRLDTAQVTEALARAYPSPRKMSDFGPKLIVERRKKYYDIAVTFAEGSRDSVRALFEGAATGADTEAFKGTAWGLYNSVIEYEDYRSHRANMEASAESALIGARGQVKERAFSHLIQVCR